MATRRREPNSDEPNAASFTVVVEQLRSEFRVLGEALAAYRDEMRAGFASVHRRFTHVDEELAVVKAVLQTTRDIKEPQERREGAQE